MKSFSLITFLLLINFVGIAQCSDLFFSEYIEGSSSNKAFEVYNPTGEPIELDDYVVYRNNNGSLTPTDSLFLQGTVVPGDVYVVANPSANFSIFAESDTTHTMAFYNGDDALWLKKISTGDTLDIIGDIGVDPGSGWTVGSGATNNNTLIRKIYTQQGQVNWAIGATEWDVFPIDMTDSLGIHHMYPCYFYETTDEMACDSLISPDGEAYWTSDGTYSDTVFTDGPFVLDTVFTINLTVLNATYTELDSTVCDSMVSPSGVYTWTSSGLYEDTITNIAGCDSILTIDLTVHNANGSLMIETVCDSFISPSGMVLASSGIYLDTITNIFGCDSVISINLTVNYSSTSEMLVEACKYYISPSGQYWDSPGMYTDTIPNAAGCDSVMTIDLVIYHVDVSVTQTGIELMSNNPFVFYQWLDCDNDYAEIEGETAQAFIATDNGNYAVEVWQDGCIDTSNCFAITSIGILENDFGNSLKVFPNPTKGKFSIDLGGVQEEIRVNIYSIEGVLLQTVELGTTDLLNLCIDGAPGYYLVVIETANHKKARLQILKE